MLKCIKFDFGWGSAPDPIGGAHVQHSSDLLAGLGVLLLRQEKGGRTGAGKGSEKKKRGRGRREGRRSRRGEKGGENGLDKSPARLYLGLGSTDSDKTQLHR